MKGEYIPLPEMIPGREHIINHIKHGKTGLNDYSGYGLLPGAKIKLLFTGPAKDPIAYEIMGTVIALRHTDSKNIFVCPADDQVFK